MKRKAVDPAIERQVGLPLWTQDIRATFSHVKDEPRLHLSDLEDGVHDEADQAVIDGVSDRDAEYHSQPCERQQQEQAQAFLQQRLGTQPSNKPRLSRKSHQKVHEEPTTIPDGQCPSACGKQSLQGHRQCYFHVQRGHRMMSHPPADEWKEDLKWLRTLISQPDNLWLLDTEFGIFPGVCAVAWEVCIRDYRGHIILKCPVDYKGATIDQLISQYMAICPVGYQLAQHTAKRLRNSFARIYPGGEAWGTTFNDMCDIITESGFDPATHAVLSYATTLDMQILWKILNGLNTPFVIYTAKDNFGLHRKQRSCFQPVNILWLVKQMLDCPDYKLKTVYRKLFGLEDSRLHRADIDTVIFLDVVRMLATFE